jgi:hypothetical protein
MPLNLIDGILDVQLLPADTPCLSIRPPRIPVQLVRDVMTAHSPAVKWLSRSGQPGTSASAVVRPVFSSNLTATTRRPGGRLFHLREALVPPGSLSLALLIGCQGIGVSEEATVGWDVPLQLGRRHSGEMSDQTGR